MLDWMVEMIDECSGVFSMKVRCNDGSARKVQSRRSGGDDEVQGDTGVDVW